MLQSLVLLVKLNESEFDADDFESAVKIVTVETRAWYSTSLECRVVYSPDQLAFDTFGAYMHTRLWSDFYFPSYKYGYLFTAAFGEALLIQIEPFVCHQYQQREAQTLCGQQAVRFFCLEYE